MTIVDNITATAPPTRTARLGAAALVAGGASAMVVHVLYGIGHGPTVLNEHGEVLGLTNDTWSQVGAIGTAMLVVGLVVLRRADRTTLMRRATGILVVGLVVRAIADWVYGLYVPGELMLLGGRVVLTAALLTGPVLRRWTALPVGATVAGWIVFAAAPDAVYDAAVDVAGMSVAGNDVVALVTALSWVSLGVGLLHLGARPGGQRDVCGCGPAQASAGDDGVAASISSS